MKINEKCNSTGQMVTRYFTIGDKDDDLVLEYGDSLDPVQIAFETYGQQNGDKFNAILFLHALTGNAHVAGYHEGEKSPGW